MKNELIIYWNYGIEKISLVNFFILISVILFLIQIALMALIVPKSEEIARSLLRTSDVDYFEGLIKPRKFNDNIKGLTIFAEDKNSNDEFINIYIKKKTSQNQFQITFAKKGIFEKKGENKILVLYEGQNLTTNNNKITNFSFSKSDFGLGDMESHLIVHKKIKEQSTIILIECAISLYFKQNKKILNCNENKPRETYKELFERLVVPLYIPLLILISAINLLITKESIHYLKLRLLIFFSGIITIIISESSIGFIQNLFFKNIFFILLPFIFFFIIYLTLFYKFKLNWLKN